MKTNVKSYQLSSEKISHPKEIAISQSISWVRVLTLETSTFVPLYGGKFTALLSIYPTTAVERTEPAKE